MIKQTLFAVVLAGSLAVPAARATSNITNLWNMPSSGGLSLDPDYPEQTGGMQSPSVTLQFHANQSANGSLAWGFKTDNADDPILTLHNTIDNDGAFSWTEYIVTVTMNKPFSFTNTPTVFTPSGWTIGITTPTGPDINGFYTGTLDLLGGIPVDPGDTLDFTYKVAFSGATQYSITESVDVVPEPATATLMGIGSLFLGGMAWARRRRS